ncbi:hypothetical protein QBC47DRAFT_419696 [Echria macrotheca]|uniref:AAA+ ATPase domain-containing protein n=1 Tax=Echria macrotheca TaxID=438768 RepID=A0AAJ0BQS1_9PEZI|nr:hypothetical protein QBC47DRAFT_419696 [Echria macrotheca]
MTNWRELGEVPDSDDEGFDDYSSDPDPQPEFTELQFQPVDDPDDLPESTPPADPPEEAQVEDPDIWNVPDSSPIRPPSTLLPKKPRPRPLPAPAPAPASVPNVSKPLPAAVCSLPGGKVAAEAEPASSIENPPRDSQTLPRNVPSALSPLSSPLSSPPSDREPSPSPPARSSPAPSPRALSPPPPSILPASRPTLPAPRPLVPEEPQGDDNEDVEVPRQTGTRLERSLRPRKPIQQHPYLLETAQYARLMKSHGVKPIRIALEAELAIKRAQQEDSEGEDYEADESQERPQETEDSGPALLNDRDDEQDELAPSPSPPRTSSAGNPFRRSSQPDENDQTPLTSFSDDDLPSLQQLMHDPSKLRMRRLKRKGSQLLSSRRKRPQIPSSSQASSPPRRLLPPPTIWDLSSSPVASAAEHQVLSEILGTTSPIGGRQKSTPGGPSSALPTSRRFPERPPNTTPILVEDEETGSDSDSASSTSSTASESDIRENSKRIKGVLPASWLRLDKQNKSTVSRNARKSPEPAPNILPKRADDSGDEPVRVTPRERVRSPKTPAIVIHEDDDDGASVVEEDWVDPMLAGRRKRASSPSVAQKAKRRKGDHLQTDPEKITATPPTRERTNAKPRPRKALRPHPVDVEAPQFKHADDPLPAPTVFVVEAEESRQKLPDKITGLGPYGTHYTHHFEIFPLDRGVFFHESTIIGRGLVRKAVDTELSAKARGPRLTVSFGLDGQTLRWGTWDDKTSSEFGIVVDWITEKISPEAAVVENGNRQAVEASDFILRYILDSVRLPDGDAETSFLVRCLDVFSGLLDRFQSVEWEHTPIGLKRVQLDVGINFALAVMALRSLSQSSQNLVTQILKVEALLKRWASAVIRGLLSCGLEELQSLYDDLQRLTFRERGIRPDQRLANWWAVMIRILENAKIPKSSFWDITHSIMIIPGIASSSDAQVFEKLWKDMFTILPLGEVDNDGVVIPGSRRTKPLDGWMLPQQLMKRVFHLYKSKVHQPPSFNEYCRALVARCHYLVQQWGWKMTSAAIGTIFDFFGSRELTNLRNEEVHQSAGFLEELRAHPSLSVEPQDRCFHIFLKLVALSIRHLKHLQRQNDIRNVIARVMPAHGRQYLRENAIDQRDLAGLRNHHDLLCTLYWEAPPDLRPGLHLIENLVIPAKAHKEAVLINLRAWSQLARFVISGSDGAAEFRPFLIWGNSVFNQVLEQYVSAASDIEQQFRALSSEMQGITTAVRDQMVAKNKASALDILHFSVVSSLEVLRRAATFEATVSALNVNQLQKVFTSLDLDAPGFNWGVIRAALETVGHFFTQLDKVSEEQYSSGASDNIDPQHIEDAALLFHEKVAKDFFWMTRKIMGLPKQAKQGGQAICVNKAVSLGARIAARFVKDGLTSLPSFFSPGKYCLFSSFPKDMTTAERKYLPLFIALLVENNVFDFRSLDSSLLSIWLLCITKPSRFFAQENYLGGVLKTHGIDFMQRAVVLSDISTDYNSNVDLFSCAMQYMRRKLRESGPGQSVKELRSEYDKTLQLVMQRMKADLWLLRPNVEEHALYVDFVRQIISLIKSYGVNICGVDPFFTRPSPEYSPPVQDPELHMATILSYGIRLGEDDERAVPQLFYYLLNNFKVALGNNKLDQERRTMTLAMRRDANILSYVVEIMVPSMILALQQVSEAWMLLELYADALIDVLTRRVVPKELSGRDIGYAVGLLRGAVGWFAALRDEPLSLRQVYVMGILAGLVEALQPSFWAYLYAEPEGWGEEVGKEVEAVRKALEGAHDEVGAVLGLPEGELTLDAVQNEGLHGWLPETWRETEDLRVRDFATAIVTDVQKTWAVTEERVMPLPPRLAHTTIRAFHASSPARNSDPNAAEEEKKPEAKTAPSPPPKDDTTNTTTTPQAPPPPPADADSQPASASSSSNTPPQQNGAVNKENLKTQGYGSARARATRARTDEVPAPLVLPDWFVDNHVSLYESRPIGSPDTLLFPLEAEDRTALLEALDERFDEAALSEAVVDVWRRALTMDVYGAGDETTELGSAGKAWEALEERVLALVHRDGADPEHMERLRRHHEDKVDEIGRSLWWVDELPATARWKRWLANVRSDSQPMSGALHASPLVNRSDPEYPACIELLAAVQAQLLAELPSGSQKELRRPVTVLSVLNRKGSSLANAIVDDVATDLKADVVHLDAATLATLLGSHMGQNLHWSRGSLSMLGYTAAEINGRQPSRSDAEGDQEMSMVVTLPYRFRSLLRPSHHSFDGRWDDLKLAQALESFAGAAHAKREARANEASQVDRHLIIHLHDYAELCELNENTVKKLRDVVDRMWQRGRKVVLVGSSAGDVHRSQQWRDQLVELGRDGHHIIPLHASETTEWMERNDNLQENMNNIKNMVHAMLGSSANPDFDTEHPRYDAGVFPVSAMEEYSELVQTLSQHVFDVQWVYRLASLMLGSRTPRPTKFRLADVQHALHVMASQDKHMTNLYPSIRPPYFSPLFVPLTSSPSFFPQDDWQSVGVTGQGPASSHHYDQHEKRLLSGLINAKDIHTTFNDIVVPAETKESLIGLTSLSLVRPDAFSYGVLKTERIPGCVLYGPPGTGKTLLAKAVAKESGANMLEVSAASINDMWLGQSEKNVRALFSIAKKMAPMVIFLDEADALLGARQNTPGRTSHRETISQFLREWDGLTDMRAFIMVATNRPFDLDEAVLRRLPRKILVDLPLRSEREGILKVMLKDEVLGEDVDLARLAGETELYSGSDLKNVCVAAAMEAVREEVREKEAWDEKEGEYVFPERRVLKGKHFEKAMREISASISEDMDSLKAIRKFDEQYGDAGRGRGRKKGRRGMGFEVVPEKAGTEEARVRRVVA